MTKRVLRSGALLLAMIGGLTVYLFDSGPAETACAQSSCPACETLLRDKGCLKKSPTPTPSPTPKKTPPLPPVKRVQPKVPFPDPPRLIGDKDLPGLDSQSGTALDRGDNYEVGRRYESEEAEFGGVGHYQERRLFIHKTMEFARLKAAAGEIPQSNLTRLKEIFTEKLERINRQERADYQEKAGEQLQEVIADLENGVNKQNAERAAMVEQVIEKMDLGDFEKHEDLINQVISENLGQERESQILGSKDRRGSTRAYSIIEKLYNKFKKDCGKKPLNPTTVLGIERMGQLTGMSFESEGISQECFSRTAVARIELPGFNFEAKKCIPPMAELDPATAFDGEWQIRVVGPLPLNGTATIRDSGKGGDWKAKATIGDAGGNVLIDAGGEAEIVSTGDQCLLWLKPGKTTGDGKTEQFRIIEQLPIPITGRFPIKLVKESCTMRK